MHSQAMHLAVQADAFAIEACGCYCPVGKGRISLEKRSAINGNVATISLGSAYRRGSSFQSTQICTK